VRHSSAKARAGRRSILRSRRGLQTRRQLSGSPALPLRRLPRQPGRSDQPPHRANDGLRGRSRIAGCERDDGLPRSPNASLSAPERAARRRLPDLGEMSLMTAPQARYQGPISSAGLSRPALNDEIWLDSAGLRRRNEKREVAVHSASSLIVTMRPQQDSNLRTRLRRPGAASRWHLL
jgi:hypothetical protein